ncbi:unnamed protein product [Polarella glacialis]|uniref:Uncharacterized protein n=1 Tax=Polarella glacialis TaxID=89957 RepID=A0A813GA10_POLGL|nr:unnamed protein product [Polarella glacialis]
MPAFLPSLAERKQAERDLAEARSVAIGSDSDEDLPPLFVQGPFRVGGSLPSTAASQSHPLMPCPDSAKQYSSYCSGYVSSSAEVKAPEGTSGGKGGAVRLPSEVSSEGQPPEKLLQTASRPAAQGFLACLSGLCR